MPDPHVDPTTWSHNGSRITVSTAWNGTETQAQLEQRHADAVAAIQVYFPPDP